MSGKAALRPPVWSTAAKTYKGPARALLATQRVLKLDARTPSQVWHQHAE